ncbi:MAG: hypothetical protein IJX96_00320 [Clostridia bacterium]|nr:hypothetical protein [Clostridia bacterium]
MKSKVKKIVASMLAMSICAGCVACATPDIPGASWEDDVVDTNKTQIYVFNYDGGYGTSWLYEVKKRFEEAHKDDVWEEGKKGVQVYINPSKNKMLSSGAILDGRDEVYFTENVMYYDYLNDGVFGDLTEAVTADMAAYGDAEGTSIEDKLTDEQKAFYGVAEEDGKTHYYALPHYTAFSGLSYNVDTFDMYGYYFKDGYDINGSLDDMFVRPNSSDKKSVGMDGVSGTSDDGLPITYDEFFLLCDYIREANHTPLTWAGNVYAYYLTHFLASLATDYEGLDQTMLNYTFDGTANSLGTIKDGKFVLDAQPTEITPENGYELYRQAGKYYGLSFIKRLSEKVGNKNKYASINAFNGAYSHMDAQEDFLRAGNDGGKTAPIAMFIDGIYWQNEASATFTEMATSQGERFSRNNRNFSLMPYPKANYEEVEKARQRAADGGKLYTLNDHMYSVCFMKANVAEWKKPLILDFMKFVNSNESLVEFTTVVGTPKSLQYTLDATQKAALSPFTRSILDLMEKSDVVYTRSSA